MSSRTIPERAAVSADDQWDLTPLFDSDQAWEAAFETVEEDLEGYTAYKGRLGESAEALRAAIAFDLDLSRRLDRLYTYAHLKNDEDQSNQDYLGRYQRAVGLYTRAGERSSFMRPELMAVDEDRMAAFLESPELAAYRFHLEKILRLRAHTRSPAEEELLAMSGEMAQTARQVFGQLDNVDLNFGTLTDDQGQAVELSHGNFTTFLQNPDRDVRRRAFDQYYARYDQHKHTIAAALGGSVKGDLFYARSRSYADCRAAALHGDRMPAAVYDNLITTVRSNLEPLFRYFDFRRRALGLETLHFYDTYVPIVKAIDFQMPYAEAVETCTQALAPLGSDYTRTMAEGLNGTWVDRYENRGKRSGAYSSGCYDSPPYILLNYEAGNINSLYTLAHEAGHSMHSLFACRRQPYVYHNYTIFVAEVASTFNETLLSDHLMTRYRDDPRMRAYLLNREIDNIRATLFRQTMFAEFELAIHRRAEAQQPLTLEAFTGIYRELLEAYFGGRLAIDECLALECLRIPHFYSAFYVYKYATGISAAIALASQVMTGASDARKRYLEFLGLGGSRFPLEELEAAGVDMTSPAPIEQAIAHFERLVAELEAVYAAL
jgi:oligoendopeptidase F